jgi:5-methylcytosine-specific restriction endonuclease McrA
VSWRGPQAEADERDAYEWAERLQTDVYACRLCGWTVPFDGTGYDELMNVCSHCAGRVHNLYDRKHGGEWHMRERATDEDLAWWGDTRDPPPRETTGNGGKAKISGALRFKVYERDGFKCVYCGSRKDLSLDHVAAESKGGATKAGNLVTACRSCNSKKKTKSLADFWEVRR